MDPKLLKEVVKQSIDLEIDEEVFAKSRDIIDTIDYGLNKSKVRITPETDPFFVGMASGSD